MDDFADNPSLQPVFAPEQVPAELPADADSPPQDASPPEEPGLGVDLDEADLPMVIEALLFAATSPLSLQKIIDCLDRRFDGRSVRSVVEDLKARYESERRAFAIEEIAGGFQIFTRPDFYPWVRKMLRKRTDIRLSRAALETLAIVAYKQPAIRADIEDIRGVAVGPILRNLMDMNLVRIVGRSEQLGRPMLYGTTRFFLQHFGLKNLKDLPDVRELERPGG